MHPISIGRIGEPARESGAYRVLVDRLWPRGIKKEQALWDEWMPSVAPSSALRTWYHSHRVQRDAFRQQYLLELQQPAIQEELNHLRTIAEQTPIILLTFSRDVDCSQVPLLRDFLLQSL